MEFQERKAQKQKRCRKKKVDTNEIDRKLQELVLDIENESCGVRLGGLVDTNDLMMHCRTEELECNSNAGTAPSASSKPEIIDLLSPPPPPPRRAHQVSRRIDVIELSDTDNDASPQHASKARELRLFIANIID